MPRRFRLPLEWREVPCIYSLSLEFIQRLQPGVTGDQLEQDDGA